MAPHSSTLAWKIPWTEEPAGLQSMGSLRVGQDWETSLSRIGEGNGNPLQCSCLKNPRDGGAWWAAIYGVAQSRTRLKWLSSSSNSFKFTSALYLLALFMLLPSSQCSSHSTTCNTSYTTLSLWQVTNQPKWEWRSNGRNKSEENSQAFHIFLLQISYKTLIIFK